MLRPSPLSFTKPWVFAYFRRGRGFACYSRPGTLWGTPWDVLEHLLAPLPSLLEPPGKPLSAFLARLSASVPLTMLSSMPGLRRLTLRGIPSAHDSRPTHARHTLRAIPRTQDSRSQAGLVIPRTYDSRSWTLFSAASRAVLPGAWPPLASLGPVWPREACVFYPPGPSSRGLKSRRHLVSRRQPVASTHNVNSIYDDNDHDDWEE